MHAPGDFSTKLCLFIFFIIAALPIFAQVQIPYPRAPFETLPHEEIRLNAGINPHGASDHRVTAFSLPDGRICVLHAEGFLLRAMLSPDGGLTFEETVNVSGKPTSQNVFEFTAASDGKGSLYVAMHAADPLGGRSLFLTSSHDFGRTWSTPVRLMPQDHPAHALYTENREHSIRLAVSGNTVAVLSSWDRGGFWVTTSSDSGTNWSASVQVGHSETSYTWNEDADIVISPLDSSIHIAFTQYRLIYDPYYLDDTSLYVTRSLDGGKTFQAETNVEVFTSRSEETYRLDLDVTPGGRLLLAYISSFAYDYGAFEVILLSNDSGANYSSIFTHWNGSYSGTHLPATIAQLAINPVTSDVLALFLHGEGGDLRVAQSRTAGESFAPPVKLGKTQLAYRREIPVAHAAGRWFTAWPERVKGTSEYQIKVMHTDNQGLVWQPPITVSTSERVSDSTGLIQAGASSILAVYPSYNVQADGDDLYVSRSSASDIQFSPETRIEDDSRQVEAPVSQYDGVSMASDDHHNLYAAFNAVVSGTSKLFVSRSSDSGRIFTPTQVGPRIGYPQIAATSDGHVWAAGVRLASLIVFHSSNFGETWADVSPHQQEHDQAQSGSPKLVALPEGKAIILWLDNPRYGPEAIKLARNSAGTDTFEVRTLDSNVRWYGKPRLCAGGETVVALWNKLSSIYSVPDQLKASISTDGGRTFQEPVVLDEDIAYFYDSKVSCSTAGTAIAGWHHYDPSTRESRLATRSFRNGEWHPTTFNAIGEAFTYWNLAIGFVDKEGDRVLITSRLSGDRVRANLSTDGGLTFPEKQWLDDIAPVPESLSALPRFSSDGQGNVWASWIDGSSSDQFSIAVRQSTDFGSTWGPIWRVDTAEPQGAYYNIYHSFDRKWVRNAVSLPGAGFIGWVGQRDSDSFDPLMNVVRSNHPPVAITGADQFLECTGDLSAIATLNGSESYDPDSTPDANDIVSYVWHEGASLVADSMVSDRSLPLGSHIIDLTVTDHAGETDTDHTVVNIADSFPPEGAITFPQDASCHGGSVEIVGSFHDTCDPDLTMLFDPGPGPLYEEHGDYMVQVSATDEAEQTASDEVNFTIDLTAPTVVWTPPSGGWTTPGTVPMSLLFEAQDEDGATGGIVQEVVTLDGCTLYDGRTFGDGDGVLSDEVLVLGAMELCRVFEVCGIEILAHPVLAIEASDCGNNVGADSIELPGSGIPLAGFCNLEQ